jgi:hypothetical protein
LLLQQRLLSKMTAKVAAVVVAKVAAVVVVKVAVVVVVKVAVVVAAEEEWVALVECKTFVSCLSLISVDVIFHCL